VEFYYRIWSLIISAVTGRNFRVKKVTADALDISVKDIIGKTTEGLFFREQAEKMRKNDQEVILSGKS